MKKVAEFDGHGRRLIVPDGADEAVAHTRVTTVAGRLDDRHALEKWKLRQTALGLAQRPDLLGLVASHTDDKWKLNQLCEQASEAAGSGAAANLGTSLHKFCEMVDAGLAKVDDVPESYRPTVAAYVAKLNELGITVLPEYSEAVVVLPESVLGEAIAGACDRIVEFGSRRLILDLKTGQNLTYSWQAIAIQLALYSRCASIYDRNEQSHRPMPDVDRDVALVAHAPSGADRCDIYFVDIAAGWEAARTAVAVGRWRGRKDLADEWSDHVPVALLEVRRQRLVERIETLRQLDGALAALAHAWPAAVPTFRARHRHDAAELDQIDAALVAIEDRFGAPFGKPDPHSTNPIN